ncbi:MAG TPA: CoA pyrophosphatase [Vicinamibacterales bacterium]|nr:CoA pyrophosphatase [Vicinamibacterales bacterium]HPW20493.1 CoA pyrophosphatase [Vicinamibacterales bacterium]
MAVPPFEELLAVVARGLARLPGAAAQNRMAPVPRPGGTRPRVTGGARPAAALLLLFPADGVSASLLLTKRSQALVQHPGQVSLPGGAVNAGESIEDAAMREAREETGIEPASVRTLGRLTPLHIPVSGFVLHTVVGAASARPVVRPAPWEVERIIEAPVEHLLDSARHLRTTRVRDGIELDMPFFELDGEQVWGATAMVLAEFVALLGVAVSPAAAKRGRDGLRN